MVTPPVIPFLPLWLRRWWRWPAISRRRRDQRRRRRHYHDHYITAHRFVAQTRPITAWTEHYAGHGGCGGTATQRRRNKAENGETEGMGRSSSSPRTRWSKEWDRISYEDTGRRWQRSRRSDLRRRRCSGSYGGQNEKPIGHKALHQCGEAEARLSKGRDSP